MMYYDHPTAGQTFINSCHALTVMTSGGNSIHLGKVNGKFPACLALRIREGRYCDCDWLSLSTSGVLLFSCAGRGERAGSTVYRGIPASS